MGLTLVTDLETKIGRVEDGKWRRADKYWLHTGRELQISTRVCPLPPQHRYWAAFTDKEVSLGVWDSSYLLSP